MKESLAKSRDVKRTVLGLAAGLMVWGVLYLLVWVGEVVTSVLRDTLDSGLLDLLPILLGGGVAAYVSGRHGLALGCTVGIVRVLFDFAEDWYWIRSYWFWYGLVPWVVYIGTGTLGGHLGERLARSRRSRSSLPGRESRDVKRAVVGLLTGSMVWAVLTILLLATKSYKYRFGDFGCGEGSFTTILVASLVYVMEIIPILLGGVLAGYFAGRLGMVLGVVVGVAHGIIICMGWSEGSGLRPWIQAFIIMYAPAGLLGGYLGLKLSRFRRRPIKASGQGLHPQDLNRRSQSD